MTEIDLWHIRKPFACRFCFSQSDKPLWTNVARVFLFILQGSSFQSSVVDQSMQTEELALS